MRTGKVGYRLSQSIKPNTIGITERVSYNPITVEKVEGDLYRNAIVGPSTRKICVLETIWKEQF